MKSFSIKVEYILSSNIPINELLNQGFETVYDQLYSHGTTYQSVIQNQLYVLVDQMD
jgi:hypothetical protein